MSNAKRIKGKIKWYDSLSADGYVTDTEGNSYYVCGEYETNRDRFVDGATITFRVCDGHYGPQALDVEVA